LKADAMIGTGNRAGQSKSSFPSRRRLQRLADRTHHKTDEFPLRQYSSVPI
jgi:hypothetical protein